MTISQTVEEVWIGVDQGSDHHFTLRVLPAQNHGLLNIRDPAQVFFDFFRVHVLAVGEDDQVLLPAGDVDVSVLVHVADVAGTEPAVFGEHCLGGFFVPVVTQHHVFALYADFPGGISVFVDVFFLPVVFGGVNPHLALFHGGTDGVESVLTHPVYSNQRCAFSDPVAFQNGDPEGVKVLYQLGRQGSAAADDDLQIAAERTRDLGKELAAQVDPGFPQTV